MTSAADEIRVVPAERAAEPAESRRRRVLLTGVAFTALIVGVELAWGVFLGYLLFEVL